MDSSALRGLIERIRRSDEAEPLRLEFNRLPPATVAEIDAAERLLGARLNPAIRTVWAELGAGDIGFAWIAGPGLNGPTSIVDQTSELRRWSQRELVAFSDDGTGNVFAFPVRDGRAIDEVITVDHETLELRSEDLSFGDWLQREAFRD